MKTTKEKLVDIRDMIYEFDQPKEERSQGFCDFIEDPNTFMCCGHKVTLEYADQDSFENCLVTGLNSTMN